MKRNIFNSYAYYYEKASIFPQQSDIDEVKKFTSLVDNNKKYSILDIGAAEGELAISLSKMGHDVTAIDISKNQIDKILKKIKNQSYLLKAIKCNIEGNIECFQNHTFDYIFFMDVIEHLRNSTQSLDNIRLLLKDKGKLIIHTPNSCSFYKFIRYIVMPWKKQNFFNLNKLGNLHLQEYDYLSIEKTLNFMGFKVKKIVPTKLSIPIINKFKIFNLVFIFLAKIFPLLSDSMLLICEKCEPINIDDLINNWKLRY